MLPLALFRERTFAGAQVAVFAISGSFFAIFLYTTIYLQAALGYSPLETGLVYLPATGLMFIVSGATARLGRKSPRACSSPSASRSWPPGWRRSWTSR